MVDAFSLLIAVFAAIGGYLLLILAHELGHSVVVLAYGRTAEVGTGDGRRGLRLGLGRLTICIGAFWRGAYCVYDSSGMAIRQRRHVLIGGPVASAMVAIALMVAAYGAERGGPVYWVLAVLATMAALQAVVSVWPRRRRRRGSDGAQIRRLSSFEPHYVPPVREGERSICRSRF